ncbi:MAG: primosomal protein N' [Flavobacteriales bacterium]
MAESNRYAEVILPQALPRLLTYRIPAEMSAIARIGMRVVVPLGRKKLLAGIIRNIVDTSEFAQDAKEIESFLDDLPIVHESQLQQWEWVADYYGCYVGEVMAVALPAALKLSSETWYVWVGDDDQSLNDQESRLKEAMLARGKMNIEDVMNALDLRNPHALLKRLIAAGRIKSEEELREKFKPKVAEFILLHPAYSDDISLRACFDELEKSRAVKQSELLLHFLSVTKWVAGSHAECPRSALLKHGFSAGVIQGLIERSVFIQESREVGRLTSNQIASAATHGLSEAQQLALTQIRSGFGDKQVALLHGVTSSGKTEIYSALIEERIAKGEQVLFLVPEIALTTQLIHRLQRFFGKRLGVYHSGYNQQERTEVWNMVLANRPGECDVIIGARSSIFLPFSRLGLIIVDEEHEQSYKQHDPAPRYHARDLALWMGRQQGLHVLLGSATPSIESYWNATHGRYELVSLTERFGGAQLPEVRLCDLRKEIKAKTLRGGFSSVLLDEVELALKEGGQVILFQNRRGYSPLWECQSCGWVPECTRCDVSMTYHKSAHQLKCHYCGYISAPVPECLACGSMDMKMLGFGTEKIEEEIQEIFPDARIQRMDLDTTRGKSSYQRIIQDFEDGVTQILVGTQMVTKGLDFNRVHLVGILNSDRMMSFPDFRSMERSFQTMMQVAGRAGRREQVGKVIIQTYNPEHWLLSLVQQSDYHAFYQREIQERHTHGYPPFMRLMRVIIKHKEDQVASQAAQLIRQHVLPAMNEYLLGPEKPYISRVNNYYLYEMLFRFTRQQMAGDFKREMVYRIRRALNHPHYRSCRIHIDVDPM